MRTRDFKKLMDNEPFIYASFVNSKGQNIDLVENPYGGDMAKVIVICKELQLAIDSTFYETDDMLAEHKEYEPSFVEGKLYLGEFEA